MFRIDQPLVDDDRMCVAMTSTFFYRIMTYFNSLKIMSLNCDSKKEEEKKNKYNKK